MKQSLFLLVLLAAFGCTNTGNTHLSQGICLADGSNYTQQKFDSVHYNIFYHQLLVDSAQYANYVLVGTDTLLVSILPFDELDVTLQQVVNKFGQPTAKEELFDNNHAWAFSSDSAQSPLTRVIIEDKTSNNLLVIDKLNTVDEGGSLIEKIKKILTPCDF